MIFWGALWFSVFALINAVHDWLFDGMLSVLIYPLMGALAGMHLRSIVRSEFGQNTQKNSVEPIHQAVVEKYEHSDSPKISVDPLTPLANAQAAALAARAVTTPIESDVPPVEIIHVERAPVEPNGLERLFAAGKNWLLGGNTVVRVGVVLLFIGLAFLAKYTAQLGFFPIEVRLAVVAVAGLALLIAGFRLRQKEGVLQYALTLQGAGVAVLYLTILASMRVYGLLPMPVAFVLMALICALGAVLAYMQNGLVLALCSFAGGFAAPLLLSTGSGNYIGLFTYYTILNLAILGIAYFKAWRPLNLLGFFATFGVATSWGILKFQSENYWPAQLFLAVFFVIYVLTAMLYACNSQALSRSQGQALVDSTLVFGTPLAAFALQVGLVRDVAFGSAYSALVFAFVYVVAAAFLVRSKAVNYRVLIECFIALGVGFLTFAVPLALDGQAIGVTWALEGLGAFWVGMRQARWVPRVFGVLLQALALIAFLAAPSVVHTLTPFINITFIGLLMLAVSAFILSYWLRHELPHARTKWGEWYVAYEKRFANPLYVYGFVLLLCAFGSQVNLSVLDKNTYETIWWIGDAVNRTYGLAAIYLLMTVLSTLYGRRISQMMADMPILAVLPVLVLVFFKVWSQSNALLGLGWLFWPLALLMHYVLLYRAEKNSTVAILNSSTWQHYSHAATVWLICALVADGVWRVVLANDLTATAWASVAGLFSALLVFVGLVFWSGSDSHRTWPLTSHRLAYLWTAAVPLAGLLFVGAMMCALTSSGQTAPLPYIPLLNPTDLAVAAALTALVFWYLRLRSFKTLAVARIQLLAALAGAVFVLINTIWLRVAHHFFGVEWRAGALFDSFIVQTGYAILWSVLALVLMVFAHRRGLRMVWMVGAALLGLTVFKLIFVDLANRGGFERIIAFISVGVMMLLIGYLAPLPPATEDKKA